MKIALLVNDRESRENLAKALATSSVVVDEYPTAEKALQKLTTVHYDLIAIHWQVYPGLNPENPRIKSFSVALQKTKLNRSALHWEVGLTVMDAIRADGSVNVKTPIVVILPGLDKTRYDAGEKLTTESVDSALATRQPASAIWETLTEQIAEKLRQRLSRL